MILVKIIKVDCQNNDVAQFEGRVASAGSTRGLAGAARAERRALPTYVPSDDFQSIPINSNHFLKK